MSADEACRPDRKSVQRSYAGAPDQSGEKTVTDRKGEAMKIRIRFEKHGVMKFVGHLDMMRYFQKAMRRAGIDIRYSEGFSPHQIMSFAAPIGVGITSNGEYLDIEVNSSRSSEESMRALNDTMVEGIRVVSYVRLPEDAKTAMSIVAAADYELTCRQGQSAGPADDGGPSRMTDGGTDGRRSVKTAEETLWDGITAEELCDAITRYFDGAPEALVTKRTKKGERTLDLKPLVYGLSVEEKDGQPFLYVMLSTGSQDNIKPELVLEYLLAATGHTFDPATVCIHRRNVYAHAAAGAGFLSLDEMGENIV